MKQTFLSSPVKSWNGVNFVTDATWGDNGKGKIVDLMAKRAELVIRANGGPNAGHTVENEFGEFKFHLIPSGIFNQKALCILSDTVVIDPFTIVEEIQVLKKANLSVSNNNLLISKYAHMIMPWHKDRDRLRESSRSGGKIGTTGRGIGPVYADRTERLGLQMGDMLKKDFKTLFERELIFQEKLVKLMGENKLSFDKKKTWTQLQVVAKILKPYIVDVLPIIWEHHEKKKRILGEAGQGVLLDLDRGTYPFVTSSHPGIAGFNIASGLSPRNVDRTIAVTKAYTTRVGSGPFPTELFDKVGEKIREVGHEYGTTTGRPRRCGWLDIPAIRYGLEVSGADSVAITKLDIFDSFEEIQICIGYKVGRNVYKNAPSMSPVFLESVTPIYESLPGWMKDTTKARLFKNLPKNAQTYIKTIEKLIGKPIEIVSVGPARDETIYM